MSVDPHVDCFIATNIIDHSLLHPTLIDAEILRGCDIAHRYQVAAVCIKPYAVSICREALQGSSVKTCSVIGFPHGSSATAVKVIEAEQAVREGASEIDMVINIGRALGGAWDYVRTDIGAVNQACVTNGA